MVRHPPATPGAPRDPRFPAGAGLGFRRELIEPLKAGVPEAIRFFELAPENWAHMGGRSGKDLRHFTERHPLSATASPSLGGPTALDEALLRRIKSFMAEHGMALYTEHLSWCSDDGHLYDLLPIPSPAGRSLGGRAHPPRPGYPGDEDRHRKRLLLRRPAGAEMSETEFISAIIAEADCLLHLDVNNIYVNSRNFGFDPWPS